MNNNILVCSTCRKEFKSHCKRNGKLYLCCKPCIQRRLNKQETKIQVEHGRWYIPFDGFVAHVRLDNKSNNAINCSS